MKEINDKTIIETYFASYLNHFHQRPPLLKLIQFEKGEILNDLFEPLNQFYIIAKGHVSIYNLTNTGAIRYISLSSSGTLLGDLEFTNVTNQSLYIEAADTVLCLSLPFLENKEALENDPVFLRFVLNQLANKLSLSASMTANAQTLEDRILFYLKNVEKTHEITSVNHALQRLHCSRRQLQKVLKKLCDDGVLVKTGRGSYRFP